ncbi:AAA family ATPase [Nesterenkonia sp. CL21]|uniref:McrB family protein n=1 Tax=Nesterenkonia sp. CL21 TaxID=3064894 RepID=UPI0028786CFE|nr:AAA family ATPase [Nesterenkonia sp. CL21]MDS2171339.1 AAA family ATPase [Nesterenkonia sp. CL21]
MTQEAVQTVPGTLRRFDDEMLYELADAPEYRQNMASHKLHVPSCWHGSTQFTVIPRDEVIERWHAAPTDSGEEGAADALREWCTTCAALRVGDHAPSTARGADPETSLELLRPLTDAYREAIIAADSVFSPGTPVWTSEAAQELKAAFVDRPDVGSRSFEEKLAAQLHGVSDTAVQLFAELWCLSLAPLADYAPVTKRKLVTEVLERMQRPVQLPVSVDAALDARAFSGGVAFKTRRPFQLALLVKVAHALFSLEKDERVAAVEDPMRFDAVLASVPEPKEPAQRHALRWMLFPDHHLKVVSESHRDEIRAAFSGYVRDTSASRDEQLLQIRDALQAEDPDRRVDFYLPPLLERWNPPREQTRAWLVRGSNVGGQDLIPGWLQSGFVSLAAAYLPAVGDGATREELKELVASAYGHAGYSAQQARLDEFDTFLNRMQEGDLVVTESQGFIHIGEIVGAPEQVVSDDDASNLRRAVTWVGPTRGVPSADLPTELAARMRAPHEVLDLTQQMAALKKLLDVEESEAATRTGEDLILPDATAELADRLHVDRSWIQEVIELLRDRPQVIFYGPPGTGKTYLAQKIAQHLAAGDSSKVKLVQFHPAYSYEDFFEGYRPTPEGGFALTPGPMRRIVDQAPEDPATPHVLIIDEINRGNLAKVFGELYFLLEYRDEAVDLMYAPDDAGFTLPPNVFVIGTMNTADRSIALVDSAMRRRFSFIALHPSEEPTAGLLASWLTAQGKPAEHAHLLEELNRRIEDPDFKVGPSYFMRDAVAQPGGLERTWSTSILPLLEEHHYGDGVDVEQVYGLSSIRAAVTRSSGQDGSAEMPPAKEGDDGGERDGDAASD